MNYNKKKWEDKRKIILKRDKYICQYYARFGRRVEASHVHHIYPIEIYPEYAYCNWNLISLCQKAHNMMHVRGTHELTDLGKSLQKKVEKYKQAYDLLMTPPG